MSAELKHPAFVCGQQHADIFLGFSSFLLETCQQYQIDELFFCTREGEFFKAVFDLIFNRSPGNSPVKTHLLEASRLSVFPATVLTGSCLDLSGLFRLYKKQSPVTILKSLGLEPEDYADLFERHGLDRNRLETEAGTQHLLEGFLADAAFTERTYPKLNSHRTAALGYLSQCFGECKRIGFVDIGWRGTIQNSIATLMPDRQFVGMYMGLAPERNIMRPNCEKLAYGPNQKLSREYVDLLHAVNVLEFVCLSTGGSASGYVQAEKGQYVAKMRIDAQEDLRIEEFSIPFQQGVLSVARNAHPEELVASHQRGDMRRKAMQRWRKLIRRPPQELVDAYFSLQSNEVFGLGTMVDQSAIPSLSHILAAPFSSNRRQQLVRFLTYNQWAQGMLLRREFGAFRKISYYVILQLAQLYKIYIKGLFNEGYG